MAFFKHVQLSHPWKFYGLFCTISVMSSNMLLSCTDFACKAEKFCLLKGHSSGFKPLPVEWVSMGMEGSLQTERTLHCTAAAPYPNCTADLQGRLSKLLLFLSFWTTLIKQYFTWRWKSATNVTRTLHPRAPFQSLAWTVTKPDVALSNWTGNTLTGSLMLLGFRVTSLLKVFPLFQK